MDMASKAPPDTKNMMYMQVAMKAASTGDTDKARQILNDNISDQNMRKQFLSNIDSVVANQLIQKGKIAEARQAIAQAPNDDQRVSMLIRLASVVTSNGDKKTALQLLDEARGILGGHADTMNQVTAQLQLATAYGPVDSSKTFEVVEPIIDQINNIVAAEALIDGFQNGQQHMFRDGEIQQSANNGMIGQFTRLISPFASIDFDRAVSVADRFSRSDIKTLAHLSLAQKILAPVQANGPGGVSSGPMVIR